VVAIALFVVAKVLLAFLLAVTQRFVPFDLRITVLLLLFFLSSFKVLHHFHVVLTAGGRCDFLAHFAGAGGAGPQIELLADPVLLLLLLNGILSECVLLDRAVFVVVRENRVRPDWILRMFSLRCRMVVQ
jgi:hypothetical protein